MGNVDFYVLLPCRSKEITSDDLKKRNFRFLVRWDDRPFIMPRFWHQTSSWSSLRRVGRAIGCSPLDPGRIILWKLCHSFLLWTNRLHNGPSSVARLNTTPKTKFLASFPLKMFFFIYFCIWIVRMCYSTLLTHTHIPIPFSLHPAWLRPGRRQHFVFCRRIRLHIHYSAKCTRV